VVWGIEVVVVVGEGMAARTSQVEMVVASQVDSAQELLEAAVQPHVKKPLNHYQLELALVEVLVEETVLV